MSTVAPRLELKKFCFKDLDMAGTCLGYRYGEGCHAEWSVLKASLKSNNMAQTRIIYLYQLLIYTDFNQTKFKWVHQISLSLN